MPSHDSSALTYNTPYDDIWRTIVDRMPHLLIPLVNEVFKESYPESEPVTPLQNEHMDSAADKIISDSYIRIRDKYYHLECQSSPDGTMAIRMIEYDFLIAIKHAEKDEMEYTINYPHSCVIYLRHKETTPDLLTVHVNFPYGNAISYKTPIIKTRNYTLDDIFVKKLLCLLPYYIVRYEDSLHDINKDDERLEQLKEEYRRIYAHLLTLQQQGLLSQYDAAELKTLIDLLVNHVAQKEHRIRKGVISMGGKVLIFPHDIAYDQGIAKGEARGEIKGTQKTKKESAFEMFEDRVPCEKVARYIHETIENVKELEKEWRKSGKNFKK